jgi:LysM repeat protein
VVSIPVDSQPARYHEVKSGETLSRIAGRYGLTTKQITDANGLAVGAVLAPGQLLHIP